MRISILPKTSLGWWSVGLVIAIIVLFVFIDIIVPASEGISALDRGIATGFAAISAAAIVTGLIGVFTRSERSILVFLTTAIGLYALIIAAGQAFGKTIGW